MFEKILKKFGYIKESSIPVFEPIVEPVHEIHAEVGYNLKDEDWRETGFVPFDGLLEGITVESLGGIPSVGDHISIKVHQTIELDLDCIITQKKFYTGGKYEWLQLTLDVIKIEYWNTGKTLYEAK